MTTPTASEAARALAAQRPRVPVVCEACGKEFAATVRRDQTVRACSPTCRSRLFRQRKRADDTRMTRASGADQE